MFQLVIENNAFDKNVYPENDGPPPKDPETKIHKRNSLSKTQKSKSGLQATSRDKNLGSYESACNYEVPSLKSGHYIRSWVSYERSLGTLMNAYIYIYTAHVSGV